MENLVEGEERFQGDKMKKDFYAQEFCWLKLNIWRIFVMF